MPDKKTTDVVVVGIDPAVSAELLGTSAKNQDAAKAISETAATVAGDLKTADDKRAASLELKEDNKFAADRKAARFSLLVDAVKTVVLAIVVGIPLMITAWRVGNAEVKVDGQKKHLDGIEKVGKETHILINSNFGVQLHVASIALRRVAELTKDQADITAAEIAERAYKDHQDSQSIIDKNKGASIRNDPAMDPSRTPVAPVASNNSVSQ